MKNSKFQAPTSRETPNRKHQTRFVAHPEIRARHSSLKLGASLVLGIWCLMLLVCPRANAQTYSIDWYKVAGGGSTSTGSVYSISGTIGQHDAGPTMSGGTYSLSGGFWALFAVQTPGAPLLKIFLTSTNTAVVSWPAPSTGFSLQQNTDLGTANWVTPAETINTNGTVSFIIVNPPVGSRFYRLKK